jgi:TIR domain
MKPRILKLFISYAREDAPIAIAVSNCLQVALGNVFAEVFIDRKLEAGLDFSVQIQQKLDETDILIIIYSGVEKPSHSWTGVELGYFLSVVKHKTTSDLPRKVVPIFLESPPAAASTLQGLSLNISRSMLEMSAKDFADSLHIDSDDGMVQFLTELQQIVETIRKQNGFSSAPLSAEQQPAILIRTMLIAIFDYLKTTVESTLKPQKQLTIRIRTSVNLGDVDLPPEARLIPVGSGSPMSIFGLPDEEISWGNFLTLIADNTHRDSWSDAIIRVVTSSLPNQIDVDNSQIIVSNDERHMYRVVLTTGTKYFDGTREFNLYFVEALQRSDFGDSTTSQLLKGLDLACRYRFMFLERSSEFASVSIRATSLDQIRDVARRLIRELNLLRRDSQDAHLDQPNVWSKFVEWSDVLAMSETWRPLELKIRQKTGEIRNCKCDADGLVRLRSEFAKVIEELETATGVMNKKLIDQMSSKLVSLVGAQGDDKPNN